MQITLQDAKRILLEADLVVLHLDTSHSHRTTTHNWPLTPGFTSVTTLSHAPLEGDEENEFLAASYKVGDSLFFAKFNEGLNQTVTLEGDNITLIDTEGDELIFTLLKRWSPENSWPIPGGDKHK